MESILDDSEDESFDEEILGESDNSKSSRLLNKTKR